MAQEPLALEGGEPVLPEGPPGWPRRDEEVREALQAAYLDGSWGKYDGPCCRRLESLLSEWSGREHVQLAASGTIAVEMALRGLGLADGDEVLLAAYDFSGNFRAIEVLGGRPVLVDLAPRSWCPDLEGLEAAVGPETRAVIISHLHGCLAPMRAIRRWADERGVAVLEDACQVPGAVVDGRLAGTWGDAGVFSFGGSKLLTSGRGGAVVTSRAEVLQRIKIFYERGNAAAPLSELQAAVLPPQLARLEQDNRVRSAAVAYLTERLGRHVRLRAAEPPRGEDRPVYYKLAWWLDPQAGPVGRQRLIDAARAEGLAVDSGFRGFLQRSARRCRRVGDLPHARRAAEATILLHHPVLLESPDTLQRVAQALEKVLDRLPMAGC